MKKSELKQSIKSEIIDILEAELPDPKKLSAAQDAAAGLNKELEKLGRKIVKQLYNGDIGKAYDELKDAGKKGLAGRDKMREQDDEPKAGDLKGEPLSKIGYKLADVQKEMKKVVKKYSAAEGNEKEKLKDRLRELTKIKKELESLL